MVRSQNKRHLESAVDDIKIGPKRKTYISRLPTFFLLLLYMANIFSPYYRLIQIRDDVQTGTNTYALTEEALEEA